MKEIYTGPCDGCEQPLINENPSLRMFKDRCPMMDRWTEYRRGKEWEHVLRLGGTCAIVLANQEKPDTK